MGSWIGGLRTAAGRVGVPLEEYQRRVLAGEKWCGACRAWHPRSAFSVDRTRYDQLNRICKIAQADYWRRRQDGRQDEHRVD